MNTSKIEGHIKAEALKKSIFFTMIKSVLFAYIFTISVFIVYGILLTYTQMTEKNIQLVVMITNVISVIIAGFYTARGVSSRGLLFGMISGMLYATITIGVSFCVSPSISLTLKTGIIVILSLFGGGLGGIVGINTKR